MDGNERHSFIIIIKKIYLRKDFPKLKAATFKWNSMLLQGSALGVIFTEDCQSLRYSEKDSAFYNSWSE